MSFFRSKKKFNPQNIPQDEKQLDCYLKDMMEFIKSKNKLPISDEDIKTALLDKQFDNEFCEWVRGNMEREDSSWDEHLDFLSDDTGFVVFCNQSDHRLPARFSEKEFSEPLLFEEAKADQASATIRTLEDFRNAFKLLFRLADKARNNARQENLQNYLKQIKTHIDEKTLKTSSPKLISELDALIFMLGNPSNRPHMGKQNHVSN